MIASEQDAAAELAEPTDDTREIALTMAIRSAFGHIELLSYCASYPRIKTDSL